VTDRLGRADLDAFAVELRRDAGRIPGTPVERRVPAVQVAPLAGLALALLALEGLPVPRRRRLAAGGAALALALLGAGPPPTGAIEALEAQLARQPGDARLLIELGIERLARGQRDGARRAFQAAALSTHEPQVAAVAYYDLGVAALEDGDLAAARDAFFDALALAPEDSRARFNLEWTLAGLRSAPPAPEPEAKPAALPERREAPPVPLPEPKAAETEPPPLPELDADQRARLLARVGDDPGLGLRAATAATAHPRQVGLNY
jgi:tetratricopeptide (TPR) repeat protein